VLKISRVFRWLAAEPETHWLAMKARPQRERKNLAEGNKRRSPLGGASPVQWMFGGLLVEKNQHRRSHNPLLMKKNVHR